MAVNSFEDVRLKGTFDFRGLESGTPKRVITITKNVRIHIEPGESLTIIGGEKPIFGARAYYAKLQRLAGNWNTERPELVFGKNSKVRKNTTVR